MCPTLRVSRVLSLMLLVWAAGCEREAPPDNPEEKAAAERAAATRTAPRSAIEVGDPLAGYRRRAEQGDVQAMMFLGRSYESLGGEKNKIEARMWYTRAAEAGDPTAAQALVNLDAPPAPVELELPPLPLPATLPRDSPRIATTPPATARASTGPVDLTKLRWGEVLGSFDTTDFVSVERDDYKPPNEQRVIFVGLTTAPDKTLMVAGTGPSGNDVQEVKLALRVRNRQNPGESRRVLQAASVANKVTRDNVSQKEFVEWVTTYLSTGKRSEPIYRNGWRIQVSGPQAEGMPDPSKHLGEAVVVELKK